MEIFEILNANSMLDGTRRKPTGFKCFVQVTLYPGHRKLRTSVERLIDNTVHYDEMLRFKVPLSDAAIADEAYRQLQLRIKIKVTSGCNARCMCACCCCCLSSVYPVIATTNIATALLTETNHMVVDTFDLARSSV